MLNFVFSKLNVNKIYQVIKTNCIIKVILAHIEKSMKNLFRKNISSISLCLVLRLALLVHAELETISKKDIANIPACVLCAECASAHNLRNKNNDTCTSDKDLSNLSIDSERFKAKDECYEHGDYYELINDYNTTFVSILPPYGNKSICKFNVSYYDVLNKTFVHDDVLFLKFGNSSISKGYMMSRYGRWKVEHKKIYRRSSIYGTQNFKFDITALTGKQIVLFSNSKYYIFSSS